MEQIRFPKSDGATDPYNTAGRRGRSEEVSEAGADVARHGSPTSAPWKLEASRSAPCPGRAGHARQFAGPMQPRQRDRIPPVRLDPLARPFRDQSRSDHHAIVAESQDLPIKPVSRRPGFKANMQPIVSARQSLDRSPDRQRAVPQRLRETGLLLSGPLSAIAMACFFLATIESHESFAIPSHGRPSVREARLGMPEQPSFLPARKGQATGAGPRT
jgi:hypothetical protein